MCLFLSILEVLAFSHVLLGFVLNWGILMNVMIAPPPTIMQWRELGVGSYSPMSEKRFVIGGRREAESREFLERENVQLNNFTLRKLYLQLCVRNAFLILLRLSANPV